MLKLHPARKLAPYFRLKETESKRTINSVQNQVATWEQLAGELGIPKNEIALMQDAFEF